MTLDADRNRIDPDRRYRAEGLRLLEQTALQVLDLLPGAHVERTRDVIQIEWGGDEGIVVLVTPEIIELRLPTVEWTRGAYGPAPSSRYLRRLRADSLNETRLREWVDKAKEVRRKEFRECKFCGERFPTEHLFDRHTCHACASEHLGVVY